MGTLPCSTGAQHEGYTLDSRRPAQAGTGRAALAGQLWAMGASGSHWDTVRSDVQAVQAVPAEAYRQ